MVGQLLMESSLSFSAFFSLGQITEDDIESSLLSYFTQWMSDSPNSRDAYISYHVDRESQPISTDRYIKMALLYLFRKASNEVREFNSASMISKHMLEKDGILLSKSRMVAGLDFVYTGELNVNLGSLGIKENAPVVDRYSALAYSIAQHVHWDLAPHRGMETHNRVSLEHVYIIQGMSLYRELSEECIRCNMRRKRYMEAKMGGIKPEQLVIAPPFWACQIDLFGPYQTFVPGYERQTRNRKMLECQIWILAVVCPTSRLVNLQVLEKTDAGGIICGFTRLACEVGMPKYVFCDKDSGIMAALTNARVTLRDLQLRLYEENEIVFVTCPVGGHDQHGQVERVIQSIQKGLEECGLKQHRLHATGLQTLCKCVENSYNSVPIGYSYSRDVDNTALLKIITPNMLRMGRSNQRQLEGTIRLAQGTKELLTKIEEIYNAWFLIWRDTLVPKIMFQPKWYESSKDLETNDLVYFQKREGALDSKWIMGTVEQIIRSPRDQVIRKVMIRYQNRDENQPRITERSIRKLVKLFSVDEYQVQEDLEALQKQIDRLQNHNIQDSETDETVNSEDENTLAQPLPNDTHSVPQEANGQDPGLQNDAGPAANTRSRRRNCHCCCSAHCVLSIHTRGHDVVPYSDTLTPFDLPQNFTFPDEFQEDFPEEDMYLNPLMSLNLTL